MICKTFFSVDEIAKAFHIPAFWVRRWIRRGRLKGYLFGGLAEERVEMEALAEFQEKNSRYRRAVIDLLKENEIPFIQIAKRGPAPALILTEDWRGRYNLQEELQGRYEALKEYESVLEQKYYPHPDLKRVRMEMKELANILERGFFCPNDQQREAAGRGAEENLFRKTPLYSRGNCDGR